MDAALIIGCSAYEDERLPSLKYAHRDARRFGEVLRTVCGLRDEYVAELTDEAEGPLLPTRTNIVRALRDGATVFRKKKLERLFLFFSGHGFQSFRDGRHYLIPRDAVRGELEDTSLAYDTLLEMLGKWGATHTVVFLDACRDVLDGGRDLAEAAFQRIEDVEALCPPGTVTFCSCSPGMSSYESDHLELGLFTAAVLEALSEAGRCRTIYELDCYLVRRVPELSRIHQRPEQSPFTRVEPLGIQHLWLVQDAIGREWARRAPVGAERRGRRPSGPPVRLSRKVRNGPALAVDFGTSFSAAMCIDSSGALHPVPTPTDETLVPSVIHFFDDGKSRGYVVGKAALDMDRHRPENTIRHVKRDLGTDTVYEVAGRSITPELATSLVLRSLKQNAEDFTGEAVRRCITGYPASFTLAQRNALERAFMLADLDPWRMISEPNIGAFAMAPEEPDWDGTALVVDLGGGTLDVAVVGVDSGVYSVLTVSGSSRVGGLDYDAAVASYAERLLAERYGLGPHRADWSYLCHQLRYEAERAKRRLGTVERTSLLLQDVELKAGGFQDIEIPLDRRLFRRLTAGLNEGVARSARQALAAWDELHRHFTEPVGRVLLAGQGDKIFSVREALESLDLKLPYVEHFQQTAVIRGLGQQLGVLHGTQPDHLLADIRHRGLGFRAMPGEPVRVSDRLEENSSLVQLVEPYSIIPTQRSSTVEFTGDPERTAVLQLVEMPGAEGQDSSAPDNGIPPSRAEAIGSVELNGCVKNAQVTVSLDIDASSTMLLGIDDEERRAYWEFQLNNLHHTDHTVLGGWPPMSRRLLHGYRVWPLTRIDEQTGPTAPITAETVDLETEVLGTERGVETMLNRTPFDPTRPSGPGLLARALIRELMGSATEAADDYALAIAAEAGDAMRWRGTTTAYMAFERLIALNPGPAALRALERAVNAFMTGRPRDDVKSYADLRQLAELLDRGGLREQAERCRQHIRRAEPSK